MRHILLIAMLGLGCGTAHADVWYVTEGTVSAPVKSVWNLTNMGGQIRGTGQVLIENGKGVAFQLSGRVTGQDFDIRTTGRGPIDACTYHGSMTHEVMTSPMLICTGNKITPIKIDMKH